ncbi:MAG: polyprenyl synthetase family protein [Clostridia bacterium]|nr:polyprenyl synthetase family protein [Clostridia bacterium]
MNNFELVLKKYLPLKNNLQSVIYEAMAYSLENGGKRIRPLLVYEFCKACGGDEDKAEAYAVAVEMIHTYSLIHDDLPCMDDDDMRRGKASNHKVYGEANALLAGDGLLTLAFEVLTKADLPSENIVRAVSVLSSCAGADGMIGGQIIDLENETKDNVPIDSLRTMDLLKTGKLIEAACVLGCLAADGSDDMIEAAKVYASSIGLAFQIKDDILDVTSSTEELGKPVGSDKDNNKSTYVSLLGLEESEKLVVDFTNKAKASLKIFGDKGSALSKLADDLAVRRK